MRPGAVLVSLAEWTEEVPFMLQHPGRCQSSSGGEQKTGCEVPLCLYSPTSTWTWLLELLQSDRASPSSHSSPLLFKCPSFAQACRKAVKNPSHASNLSYKTSFSTLHPIFFFPLSSYFPIPRLSQRGCDWFKLTDAFQISSPSLLWRSSFSPDALPPLPCPLLSPFTGACCKGLAIFPLQTPRVTKSVQFSSSPEVCVIEEPSQPSKRPPLCLFPSFRHQGRKFSLRLPARSLKHAQ